MNATTSQPITWDTETRVMRLAVAGMFWRTRTGEPDRTARRIAGQSWSQLSPAARRILSNAGVLER